MESCQLKKWSVEDLKEAIKISKSYADVLRYLNIGQISTNYRTIKKYIKKLQLDISHFEYTSHAHGLHKYINSIKYTDDKLFCVNDCPKNSVRKRFKKITEYKCVLCNNLGIHRNSELTLQLDHINGNRRDNRLENLRWLCPNCHSQTETFGTKNLAVINYCADCKKKIGKKSIRCKNCSYKTTRQTLKFEISKDELIELIKTNTWVSLGKKFGVSDVSVKKRAKKLGIL